MQNSSIEWTDHSFNPWWGCQRVSPGCEHCYAETLAHRYNFKVWGPAKTTERRVMSDNYWKQPIKWDRLAQVSGRKRVFCASMADVFEEHSQIEDARIRLFNLIDQTPNLDWLLLTKRPQNIMPMMADWLTDFPQNIWIGTSCEDQKRVDERIPHLLRVPAKVRFLSCEPLLGPLDLSHYLVDDWTRIGDNVHWHEHPALHWIICGGESGAGARPMHPDWAWSLRDQCQAAGVSFFFKQWGEYEPYEEDAQPPFWNDQHGRSFDGHGLNIVDPESGEMGKGWHEESLYSPYAFRRVGKHAAGRLLDGREWNELPTF